MGTFPQYDHPHTLARYADVADALGIQAGKNDEEKLENLIEAIDALKERVGIKKTIRDYGVDEKEFLERLDEMSGAGLRRPVHRSQSAVSADAGNPADVSQCLLRHARAGLKIFDEEAEP